MKTSRCNLFLAMTIGLMPVAARATDTSRYVVNKHQNFDQTNSGPAVFQNPAAPYTFEASVNANADNLVLGLSLELPNGTSQSGVPQTDQPGYTVNPSFPTLAALDAAYPAGQYVLTITNANDGIKVVTNNLPASVYPSTPHVNNYDAAQKINPLADFTVAWDAFTGGTTNDFIQLQISDAAGNSVFNSPSAPGATGALNGLSNSVAISANTFTANQTYSAILWFFKVINVDTSSYPGAQGYTLFWKQTFFSLQTTNPPGVFPIATNGTVSQAGLSAAFSGTNYLVGIQGDAVAHDDVTAQLISTNGAMIGSRIAIGRTGGIPWVGFDGTNYLLVWDDDELLATGGNDQIYGQRVSPSGLLVGSPFTFGPTNEQQGFTGGEPLAGDGKHFLVVWDTGAYSNATNGDVHAALFNSTGSLIVPVISITSGAVAALTPSVTFGKTNYLVVWSNRRSGDPELYDIYGRFISTDGLPGSAFAISQTPTPSYNPCSAGFDGTNFFVAWNKDIGAGYPSDAVWNIYGRQVTPAGTFPGNEVAMVTDTNGPIYPFITFDGANYLMAWHAGTATSQVTFQFFNPSASPIGPEFYLFPPQGTNAPIFGGVLFGDNHFLITAVLGDFGGGGFSDSTGTWGTFLPKSTASPTFDATGSLTGKQFSLQLTGTPGINYAIQISTNLGLSNWTTVATNSPINGAFSFTDTHATNQSRFYRAVKQ